MSLPQNIIQKVSNAIDNIQHCFVWKCPYCKSIKVGALLGGGVELDIWKECIKCSKFFCLGCVKPLSEDKNWDICEKCLGAEK